MKMRANAKLVGEVTETQTALATGKVDILVGGGEWVTAGLAQGESGPRLLDPREGGIVWSQSLAMFAQSRKKDLALKFIQYVMSPEARRGSRRHPAIGHARQSQVCAWRRREANPALRRARLHFSGLLRYKPSRS
jgi:ABC-type Fe3+ transport system substrate-binding protein